MKIHLFSVLEVDAQCRARAACFGSRGEQCSSCVHRRREPCGTCLRTEMWLLRQPPRILKLPKAAAQGPLEIPLRFCSSACWWFCGEGTEVGTNQSRAGVPNCPTISGPQERTPSTGGLEDPPSHWLAEGHQSLKPASLFPANPGT